MALRIQKRGRARSDSFPVLQLFDLTQVAAAKSGTLLRGMIKRMIFVVQRKCDRRLFNVSYQSSKKIRGAYNVGADELLH